MKELYNNKEFLKTEPFIESAIIQYTDYLENMFELSNKYDNMNNQIELMLRQELKLDEIQSLTERIDKINEEIENVTFLKERLNILHEKYAKQISPSMIPFIAMMGGCIHVLQPLKGVNCSVTSAVRIVYDLLQEKRITRGVSLQSFLEALEKYKIDKKSKKRKKAENV